MICARRTAVGQKPTNAHRQSNVKIVSNLSCMHLFRLLFSAVGSLGIVAIAEYLYFKLSLAWSLWNQGISDRAELSEDYGGAAFMLMGMAVVLIVVLPTSLIALWRYSGKWITGQR